MVFNFEYYPNICSIAVEYRPQQYRSFKWVLNIGNWIWIYKYELIIVVTFGYRRHEYRHIASKWNESLVTILETS